MLKNGKIKTGDSLMLWGVILTMMGILGIIQMGVMEGLPGFILYGSILVLLGLILLVVISITDCSRNRRAGRNTTG